MIAISPITRMRHPPPAGRRLGNLRKKRGAIGKRAVRIAVEEILAEVSLEPADV
jgi:hypothetical protein